MKKARKVSMQIYLEPEQEKILARLSKTTGKSKAALIRHCIDKVMSDLPPEDDPIMDIVGLGASGKHDISEKHDDYLVSSFNKEKV